MLRDYADLVISYLPMFKDLKIRGSSDVVKWADHGFAKNMKAVLSPEYRAPSTASSAAGAGRAADVARSRGVTGRGVGGSGDMSSSEGTKSSSLSWSRYLPRDFAVPCTDFWNSLRLSSLSDISRV